MASAKLHTCPTFSSYLISSRQFSLELTRSALLFLCGPGENRKWETALIPFIQCPTSRNSEQPLYGPAWLKGLRPGQKLELGSPMVDPDTGVPVPILAVTIHPQTGLVYPLGGLHLCPLTRISQPIQIGSPVLEPRLGKLVLTVGVSLDPATGQWARLRPAKCAASGWKYNRLFNETLCPPAKELCSQLEEFCWGSRSLNP